MPIDKRENLDEIKGKLYVNLEGGLWNNLENKEYLSINIQNDLKIIFKK